MAETRKATKTTTLLLSLGTGLASGLAGFTIVRHLTRTANPQSWSDSLALIIATALLVLGVSILSGGLFDRLARAMARSETVTPKMKRQFLMQGLTMLLAALMLGAPPLLQPAYALDRTQSAVLLIGIAILFAVQTVINIALWRRADEFYRRAMLETSAISFWVLQGALFLWAVAERTGFAPALQTWDCVAVLMAVYLALSFIVAKRIGAG